MLFRSLVANVRDATSSTAALNRNFQTFAVGWSGRVDPDGNFYQFINSKGSQNDSGYVNASVDKATNEARAVLKLSRRIADYHTDTVEVWTNNRPDGRRPDHQRQVAATIFRAGIIGHRKTSLEVDRTTDAKSK